jgi:hypothetical protein
MRRRALALLPAVVAALACAGCGDPAFDAPPGRPITIALREYRLDPAEVHARAGRLTFVAVDRGRLVHNLAIETIPDDPADAPVVLGRSRALHPGQRSAPLTLRLRPGRYRLLCTIANHDDLGQYGTLTVTR